MTREYYLKHAERFRTYARERKRALRAAGLCQECARAPRVNATRCEPCRDDDRADKKAKRDAGIVSDWHKRNRDRINAHYRAKYRAARLAAGEPYRRAG